MKKSIIALFSLVSSYVYAEDIIGTVVSIESANKLEECYTCSPMDLNGFNYNVVSDLQNDIVTVKTSDNKVHVFKIESKYAVKIGQKITIDADTKIYIDADTKI